MDVADHFRRARAGEEEPLLKAADDHPWGIEHLSCEQLISALQGAVGRGSSKAQVQLARIKTHGCCDQGIAKGLVQKSEGARLYKLGAERGDPSAQRGWAYALAYGEGVAEDRATSATWYYRAAESGDRESQRDLADRLRGDRTMGIAPFNAPNPTEALRWYKLAAEQGDMRAMASYGRMLFAGEGAEKDQREGMYWITEAAISGDYICESMIGHENTAEMRARVRGLSWAERSALLRQAVSQVKVRDSAKSGGGQGCALALALLLPAALAPVAMWLLSS